MNLVSYGLSAWFARESKDICDVERLRSASESRSDQAKGIRLRYANAGTSIGTMISAKVEIHPNIENNDLSFNLFLSFPPTPYFYKVSTYP